MPRRIFPPKGAAENQLHLHYTPHSKEHGMQRDPIRARYTDAVENLLAETLDINVNELIVQDKVWTQLVEIHNTDSQYWEKFLETTVHDGYLARWISVLLAPSETLRPYAWPTGVTIPDAKTVTDLLTALDHRRNAPRLKEFVAKLRELNTSFDILCIW